jgi:putative ABC transport system permease protein
VRAELDDELRFHMEEQTRLHMNQGLSPDEAARRARLKFGIMEATANPDGGDRDANNAAELLRDVRYAARALWRDRGLAVAGVLTLALGIGATTAVFSAVNAVMLRELPFRDSDRLVAIWEENSERGWYKNVAAPANYLDWRARATAFESMAAYTDYLSNVTLLGEGEPRLLISSDVTSNFLHVLGVTPALGRPFEVTSDSEGDEPQVMISHRLWRDLFRGDSGVVGRSLNFGGSLRWKVAGVMPEGFAMPSPTTDVWKTLLFAPGFRASAAFRRAHWMRVIGRMKPGVSLEAANASLQTVVKQLQVEHPVLNSKMGAGITPIREWIVGDTRQPLLVLLAAAGILLLIACVNVGNLLLVHALGRSRDVSLRFALGASRARVARQALTESLVLSMIGGAAGVGLAWVGARALLAMQPTGMLPVTGIALDHRVWMLTLGLITVSGLLFGMAPALFATRQSPADALNSGGRAITGGRLHRGARHLVVAEVALAVVLTVGAGLLLRSYDRLSKVPAGFDPEGVLTMTLTIPAQRYDSASKVIAFYETLQQRLEALPGVERVAAVTMLPATTSSWSSSMAIRGRDPLGQTDILHREVLGDYFRLMRVPVISGRTFEDSDRLGTTPVVVVNDVLVKEFFGGEDPLGAQVAFDRFPDSTSTWRTIVGVVGSERQGSLATPPRPEIFAPVRQDWRRGYSMVARMRAGSDPISIAGPARQAVRELDSLLAVESIRPMTDVHSAALSRQRFVGALVFVFAATGVLLALVGVFGVLAQLVQTRWRELGIRMALGAQRSQVRWLVVRHGGMLLVAGTLMGLAAAAGATRVLESLLFEVEPLDAPTFIGVAMAVVLAGVAAAWIPAMRASTANPAVTLRAE